MDIRTYSVVCLTRAEGAGKCIFHENFTFLPEICIVGKILSYIVVSVAHVDVNMFV